MRFWLSFFFVLTAAQLRAQNNYSLKVVAEPQQEALLKNLKYNNTVSDSLLVYKEAEKIISQLQFKGYLLAEISSIGFKQKNAEIRVRTNQLYKLVSLSPGNLPADAMQAVGFRLENYQNIDFDITRLNRLFENLLVYFDNRGYPFANINLDNINITKENIFAQIQVKLNNRLTYDTVQIIGSAKINPRYIQSYLNLKPGSYYRENDITKLQSRIRELPFVTEVKSPEVEFTGDKATVNLFLNKRNANQFDGILGLITNKTTNKLEVTGNLRLQLQNAFKGGEQINFNYQGLPQGSQLLNLATNLPNFLNTAIALNAGINLYKQDTAYLNVDTKLGFGYLFKANQSVQFFVDHRSTSLIAVDQYKNATQLPSILDANTTFYGLGVMMETLDYRYNPQKGYSLTADVSIGSKQIRKNSAIAASLYQNIELNSTSYRIQSKFSYYIPLAKQTVLALSNETGILNGKYLIDNELFRLGGQRSLRGFNELSILANRYTYFNIETRYLLEQNSFLFAFYNQAFVQQQTALINEKDFPLGFGAGINFETNLGILSVSYALGKQKNNPLNLRQGKVHFGIIALF